MNEPHDRFLAWLLSGSGEAPPRDLALHASVCPECQRAIAAVDLLARVDPGLAPAPPFLPARAAPRVQLVRMAAATAGVGVLAAVIGVSAAQLMGLVGRSPEENVLGATGTPQPTPSPEAQPTLASSFTPLPTSTPTPAVTVTPITPPPVTPPPATPRPTRPPTPAPTPIPTEAPTDTPAPTAPGSPVLAASAGDAFVDLTWTTPDDGGSPISGYNIYRGSTSGGEVLLTTVGAVNGYTDLDVVNGQTYFYRVSATNSVGEGDLSTEVAGTPEPPAATDSPAASPSESVPATVSPSG